MSKLHEAPIPAETGIILHAPLLLRVEEAAALLSVSKGFAWQLVWSGQLPHIKLGKRAVRIPVQTLEQWIADNQKAKPTCRIAK